MRRKLTILAAICAAAAVGVQGIAGNVPAKKVAAGSKWVLYLDVSEFRDAQLWQQLQQKFSGGMEKKMEAFKNKFGYHPIDNVDTVLMYGDVMERGKGVFLLSGEFNVEKLVALVKKEGKDYDQVEANGRTLHHWTHSKHGHSQEMWGTALGSEKILIADTKERLQNAISILQGDSEHLDSDSDMANAPGGKVLGYVATSTLPDNVGSSGSTRAQILNLTESGHAFVREQGNNLQMRLSMKAVSKEASKQVQEIIQGFKALAAVRKTEEGQELPPQTKFLESITLEKNGKNVIAESVFPVNELVELMPENPKAHK